MHRFKLIVLFILYIITLFSLCIYSYSQIDLNLTLSSNSLYQSFQKKLIYLGYFNRPVSTSIYLLILCLLFVIYYLLLKLIGQKKISRKSVLWLISGSSVILLFSYPAFSHDIFNYLFDARILTKYFSNPYSHSALDFPFDLWTRFMHWTHRTYPYGPFWLLITLPFSFLGFGKFVATLFLFKLMFTLFYLGNIFLIKKILGKISPKDMLFGVSFYAFSPLILIESLISPHNETAMLFFLLAAIYFGILKRRFLSGLIHLFLSAGVKFITIILLPLFFFQKRIKDKPFLLFKLFFLFLIPPLIYLIVLREPHPWYFITFIGLGALLPRSRNLAIFISCISLGALLRYAPFLLKGEYTVFVVVAQWILFVTPVFFLLNWLALRAITKRLMV